MENMSQTQICEAVRIVEKLTNKMINLRYTTHVFYHWYIMAYSLCICDTKSFGNFWVFVVLDLAYEHVSIKKVQTIELTAEKDFLSNGNLNRKTSNKTFAIYKISTHVGNHSVLASVRQDLQRPNRKYSITRQ